MVSSAISAMSFTVETVLMVSIVRHVRYGSVEIARRE